MREFKELILFRLVLLFTGFIFFSSCAHTNFMPPENRVIPNDFFGIAPYDGHLLAEKDYAVIDTLGAVWFRRTFNWSRFERKKGEWNFTEFDLFVESAKQHNKKIIAILAYDPNWLYKSGREYYIGADTLDDYLLYVEKVVSRYKGKIDAYEIWNEPNGLFWHGSIKEFSNLTKAAAIKIRQTDPGAKILAGAFFRVPDIWLNVMFKQAAFENIDAISFHPYAVKPVSSIRLYDNISSILEKNNWTKDIWITEVGYPTSGWYPSRVSIKKYPSHIVKTIAGLAARGARMFAWYELFDEYNAGDEKSKFNSEDFFGLIYPDFSFKKGADAYALCAKFIAGAAYSPVKFEDTSLQALHFVKKDTGSNFSHALFMWNDTKKMRITLAANNAASSGAYKLYDIDTGAYTQAEGIIEIGSKPVILQWTSPNSEETPVIEKAINTR